MRILRQIFNPQVNFDLRLEESLPNNSLRKTFPSLELRIFHIHVVLCYNIEIDSITQQISLVSKFTKRNYVKFWLAFPTQGIKMMQIRPFFAFFWVVNSKVFWPWIEFTGCLRNFYWGRDMALFGELSAATYGKQMSDCWK